MQNSNSNSGQEQAGGQQSALQPKSGQQGQQADGGSNAPPKGQDDSRQWGQGSGSGQQGSGSQASQQGGTQGEGAASHRPNGGETLARAAQGAHRAVDATVEKVAPVIDVAHDKVESAKGAARGAEDATSDVQDRIGAAKDQAGEWIGAARDAIAQNPFAAIAGAFLIGAVYASTKRR